MKKKVLIITLAYFPLVGGAEIAWQEITKRLKDKYDFKIITAKLNGGLNRNSTVEGIPVVRFGIGLQWFDKLFFYLWAVLYGLEYKHDITIGVLENQSSLAALTISKLKGTKCFINLQSGDSEEYIYNKLGWFGFLYNWVYNKKAKYLVLSKYLSERAVSHGVPKKNITIIPNGVDTKLFSPQKKVLPYHNILSVGRLVYKNGTDVLIKAFAVIKKKYSDSTLTICGMGEGQYELSKLANRLGVSDSVVFTGNVDYGALPVYYGNASVFVRPSRSEGFGNSFVEAMACGVPIIGTRVGGIPDFLVNNETGLFCKTNNPQHLAGQMIRLLEDRDLYTKIKHQGEDLVKHYDWSVITKKYVKALG
jgi:glycosyltransferase involved in cell wall biosynthesis